MSERKLLALDFGASNGRGILGRFDGERVTLTEVHRFENSSYMLKGKAYWDIPYLVEQCKRALGACHNMGEPLDAFGIDTWGVDYGLLDKNGELLGNVLSYRNARDADMPPLWEKLPRRALFERTGVAHLCFNTVYQLHQQKLRGDASLEQAKTLLFLPDLLAYFLTGERGAEYTFATTSMLYNPLERGWDTEICKALGISSGILPDVQPSGVLRGGLCGAAADDLHMGPVPFAVVGQHDTASAVAAIPGAGDFAFCSSGTWSLFGVETEAPVLTEDVYKANFSNEGTVQGGFRPLKNIMGLWLVQECRRAWQQEGQALGWGDIADAARAAAPLRSVIDPDMPAFFEPGDMPNKIRAYCADTGQPVPESMGEIARCVYESLALKYRWALERLEEIKGGHIHTLDIVGGGIQNTLLNQMAADATGRRVITGPVEGAAMGNILMQAVALGELGGIAELRQVVRASVDTQEYLPGRTQAWEDAYGKLMGLMEEAK